MVFNSKVILLALLYDVFGCIFFLFMVFIPYLPLLGSLVGNVASLTRLTVDLAITSAISVAGFLRTNHLPMLHMRAYATWESEFA